MVHGIELRLQGSNDEVVVTVTDTLGTLPVTLCLRDDLRHVTNSV
jgi:hypothetical protein